MVNREGATPENAGSGQTEQPPSLAQLTAKDAAADRNAANDTILEEFRPMYIEKGFHDKADWRNAPAVYDGHTLKILDHPVMEDWERPYMQKLAEIATSNEGTVLEVGFGMGISAGFIDKAPIEKHIIIEANHEVAERAREFARNATKPTEVMEGLWKEVIDSIPSGSIDGILYDAYPLEEAEIMNQARFAPTAFEKLREGGIFTYFSDEIDRLKPQHLAQLTGAGFAERDIEKELVVVNPPPDCEYWQSDTIVAPIVRKNTSESQ